MIATELGLKGAVFVGHSVSAMIGIMAAKERPELFDRLVLVERIASPRNSTGTRARERHGSDRKLMVSALTMDHHALGRPLLGVK